jgi:hypothetical protein
VIARYAGLTPAQLDEPLGGDVFLSVDEGKVFPASSDAGDLCWKVPLSILNTSCWPLNVPVYSWGVVASGSMGIGHKGMMDAAKVMALPAVELFKDPATLQAAREPTSARFRMTSFLLGDGIPTGSRARSRVRPPAPQWRRRCGASYHLPGNSGLPRRHPGRRPQRDWFVRGI